MIVRGKEGQRKEGKRKREGGGGGGDIEVHVSLAVRYRPRVVSFHMVDTILLML